MSEIEYPPPPETLGGLIMLALDDWDGLDRDVYWPHARLWHSPAPYKTMKVCYACLAGGVIGGTLQADPHAHIDSFLGFGSEWLAALCALDDARRGWYDLAWKKLCARGVDFPEVPEVVLDACGEPPHPDYFDWEEFDAHLDHQREVARRFIEAGV